MMFIKVDGLGKVQKSLTGYTRRLPEATKLGSWRATQRLAQRLREAAPKGATRRMSTTKGTKAVKIDKKKGEDRYGIKMPYYTPFVESGTQPHYVPFRPKIAQWAKMHGMTFHQLWSTIAGKGTEPHPFTAVTIMKSLPEMIEIINKHNASAIKRGR